MKIPTVKNCCPSCSGRADRAFKLDGILHLRCEHCGYIAPKICFDSLDQNDRHRVKNNYVSLRAADAETAEREIRNALDSELSDLKRRATK